MNHSFFQTHKINMSVDVCASIFSLKQGCAS